VAFKTPCLITLAARDAVISRITQGGHAGFNRRLSRGYIKAITYLPKNNFQNNFHIQILCKTILTKRPKVVWQHEDSFIRSFIIESFDSELATI
jgi:hypothetical protein